MARVHNEQFSNKFKLNILIFFNSVVKSEMFRISEMDRKDASRSIFLRTRMPPESDMTEIHWVSFPSLLCD